MKLTILKAAVNILCVLWRLSDARWILCERERVSERGEPFSEWVTTWLMDEVNAGSEWVTRKKKKKKSHRAPNRWMTWLNGVKHEVQAPQKLTGPWCWVPAPPPDETAEPHLLSISYQIEILSGHNGRLCETRENESERNETESENRGDICDICARASVTSFTRSLLQKDVFRHVNGNLLCESRSEYDSQRADWNKNPTFTPQCNLIASFHSHPGLLTSCLPPPPPPLVLQHSSFLTPVHDLHRHRSGSCERGVVSSARVQPFKMNETVSNSALLNSLWILDFDSTDGKSNGPKLAGRLRSVGEKPHCRVSLLSAASLSTAIKGFPQKYIFYPWIQNVKPRRSFAPLFMNIFPVDGKT